MGFGFREALEENQPLEALGDVRFRYQESLFIGTARSESRPRKAPAVWTVGSVAGASAFVLLLIPGAPIWLTFVLTGISALAMTLGTRLDREGRTGRVLVLNFATETLRLDSTARFTAAPRSVLVPFDAVKDVLSDGQTLSVTYELGKRRHTAILVDRITPEETGAREKGHAFFRAAFGLKPPVPAEDPSPVVDEWLPPSPRPPST